MKLVNKWPSWRVLWTHFTASRVSLKKPEPSFGLVDWRERERASSCAGSRGGVEGGLRELDVPDMGGIEGSTYQAAPALWRPEPMMNIEWGRDVAIANLSGARFFPHCISPSIHR